MKILFISYYFDPYPGVGAKRVSYWADEIGRYGYEPTVITASKQKKEKPYPVYYVENTKQITILSRFVKDEGLTWTRDLETFINKTVLPKFNVILISGGPFMHFGIGKMLKRLYPKANLIIDFRDPFGNNPRYSNESVFKRIVKQYFESKFIKMADNTLVVNQFCKNLISNHKSIYIIENGYDERALNNVKQEMQTDNDFIYTGKIREEVSLDPFIEALNETKYQFRYFGSSEIMRKYKSPKILITPHVTYTEVLNNIAKSKIGLIFTGGELFESTTKVFDYMALNKRILIITDGDLMVGNLHQITKTYPNTFWCKNNEKDIKKAIDKVLIKEPVDFDSNVFSRKKSLQGLIKLIEE